MVVIVGVVALMFGAFTGGERRVRGRVVPGIVVACLVGKCGSGGVDPVAALGGGAVGGWCVRSGLVCGEGVGGGDIGAGGAWGGGGRGGYCVGVGGWGGVAGAGWGGVYGRGGGRGRWGWEGGARGGGRGEMGAYGGAVVWWLMLWFFLGEIVLSLVSSVLDKAMELRGLLVLCSVLVVGLEDEEDPEEDLADHHADEGDNDDNESADDDDDNDDVLRRIIRGHRGRARREMEAHLASGLSLCSVLQMILFPQAEDA
ncbi:hypothetical protein Tco_0574458 [Tanacetum coccineum]